MSVITAADQVDNPIKTHAVTQPIAHADDTRLTDDSHLVREKIHRRNKLEKIELELGRSWTAVAAAAAYTSDDDDESVDVNVDGQWLQRVWRRRRRRSVSSLPRSITAAAAAAAAAAGRRHVFCTRTLQRPTTSIKLHVLARDEFVASTSWYRRRS